MNSTKIDWCDRTWNPVTGCFHRCEYCYAAGIARRFGGAEGGAKVRFIGNCVELDKPLYRMMTNGQRVYAPFPFGFFPTFHRYRLEEPQHSRKARNIFVCSMADLFGDWVPLRWIQSVFAACKAAPQHRYLFLTKNPKRYGNLYKAGNLPKLKNFWYGTTITKQADRRFPGTICLNTFLSIEPLSEYLDVGLGSFGGDSWIIIGAETGKYKGKIIPEKAWVENIEEAAALTHIPVFMKDSLLPIVGEANMRREFPWRD